MRRNQEDRGQYIKDLDTFFKWNEVNSYIWTEHKHASIDDKDRHTKAMQNLNLMVDKILILEHNNG